MITTARDYHLLTSYRRRILGGHCLDWRNQPTVYKTYPGIALLPLPLEIAFPSVNLSTLLTEKTKVQTCAEPSATDLARVLLLSYSITARACYSGAEFCYRSVASAGALYPSEIYVACRNVPQIPDGLYHYALAHHCLCPIRAAEAPSALGAALLSSDRVNTFLTFILSTIFFRTAWKYRERSYRYLLLDAGHVLEQLVLSLRMCNLPALISYDFPDHAVNRVLGFDETKEVALALCCVPTSAEEEHHDVPALTAFDIPCALSDASRVSAREVDYPLVREMHQAGTIDISTPLAALPSDPRTVLGVSVSTWEHLTSSPPWPERLHFARSVAARRSRRTFTSASLPYSHFTALVESLCSGSSVEDASLTTYERSVAVGVLIGNVDKVPPGFYLLASETKGLGMVRAGSLIPDISHVCLDQEWLSGAALHFLFFTNLELLDRNCGPRGYRYAMMTAGRWGERLYLAATALGIGCCGIGAFYDDEAVELLGLAEHARLLYLVAVGQV